MVTPATMVGFITPVVTAWLSDSLPRKGLSTEENERRIRNIALSIIAGFGVAAIANQLAGGGGGSELSVPKVTEKQKEFVMEVI